MGQVHYGIGELSQYVSTDHITLCRMGDSSLGISEHCLNSFWTCSALVQIMAHRLFDTKILPEPILIQCQTDHLEQNSLMFKSLRPRQNRRYCADDIFKCNLLNENVWIPIKISLKFNPKGPINNIPALVQIMAWRRTGDKPLSEPMILSSTTHICVTRPQWVKKKEALFLRRMYLKMLAAILFLSVVLRLEYSMRWRSIPWLLMPWFLMSPDHW